MSQPGQTDSVMDAGDDTGYPRLYSPLRLGRVTVPNRFVVPALTTNFAEADGVIGDRLIDYLEARFAGGYGLVVTENIGVHPSGRVMPRMAMAHDDRFLGGLRRLAERVQGYDGVLFGQLSHAGRQTRSAITGMPLVAASAIPCPLNREEPRALETHEVEDMERAFVEAACRLAEAGFQGVEIHGAHGYLVGGFLSRYSNIRTDHYGGSLSNRMRFLLNIVAGIKSALGQGFPVSVRISAREFVPDGLDLPESIEVARRLADAGVDALSVSVGVYASFNRLSMITGEPEGRWLDLAGALRREVSPMPVIGVGRIKRPEIAERALADGLVDLAAFGRASIADPHLPRKVREARSEEVMWCLGCNVCLGRSSRPESICPVNPAVGLERRHVVSPAARPMRVRVLGASLSALTAAWIAARRGHQVTVTTPGGVLGGMQRWRAGVPGQEEYEEVIAAAHRRAAGVGVRFADWVPSSRVDATWRVHNYQPVDDALLQRHTDAVDVYRVLSGDVAPGAGERVLVYGADLATVEAGALLRAAGCEVRLRVPARDVALDAHPGYREANRQLLETRRVDLRIARDIDGLEAGDIRWADHIVIGDTGKPRYEDPAAWRESAVHAGEPTESVRADAVLADAYEPGLMTRGIYDAVDMALEFEGQPQ
ncbi:MAG: tRNA-dihydrouridine synthase [Ectothiorhodospiraceae bacterium]|nr:tRNA-dihydrouridine synthase [Ectothiorhodospiraceae bacterium]